jgi:hypothetical protein
VRSVLTAETEAVGTRVRLLLDPGEPLPDADPACPRPAEWPGEEPALLQSLRSHLWKYYRHFEDYDQISFPTLYQTDVAESDVVEIIRISPEDATSLIDERKERGMPREGRIRRKLAGTALFNFGAFLDRAWRQNDILWGRLDGAERLISSLLPNEADAPVRSALIAEAHLAILSEELPPASRTALSGLFTDALLRASAGDPAELAVRHTLARLDVSDPVKKRLETVLANSLKDEELLAYLRDGYEVNRRLDPGAMLRLVSRSTQVIGNVFEAVAERRQLDGGQLRWIARLGRFFWGIVEVAVPHSLAHLLFVHWVKLLYAFAVVIIVGAVVLGAGGVARFGWTLLGVVAAVHILVLVLHDTMRLRKRWRRLFLTLLIAFVLFLAAVGADEIFGFGVRQTIAAWW